MGNDLMSTAVSRNSHLGKKVHSKPAPDGWHGVVGLAMYA